MEYGCFINGDWVKSDKKIPVENPFTKEIIGYVYQATEDLLNQAVEAAQKSFYEYKEYPAHRRYTILTRISQEIEKRADVIAKTITAESGKPIRFSEGEVKRAVQTYRFAAEEAKRISGETVPMDAAMGGEGRMGFYIREPIGPVAAISPFNFPLNLAAHKIAPSLAAGNTVVWKPATSTPLTAGIFSEICKDTGVPDGVVNIIFGSGDEVGDKLVKHPSIKAVSFTGSPPVGKHIRNIAGLKRILLELGSNSALMIDNDVANIDEIADRAIIGAFANAGQVCISIQRIYIHKDRFSEFSEKFVERAKNVSTGDPTHSDVIVGPMINQKEAERAEMWVQEAIEAGARYLLKGKREGNLMYPTVLTDVDEDMKVVNREIFAPVVNLIPVENFAKGIEKINKSRYGLNAGVYTNNFSNVLRFIKEVEAGGIIINDYPTFRVDQMPYGGVKESGLGREGLKYAIQELTEIKFVSYRG